MNQDCRLLLDGDKIRTCIIYNDISYDDSVEYCIYDWSDSNPSVVEDVAFRSKNGKYEFSDTLNEAGYPIYSTISYEEYAIKKAECVEKIDAMLLDTDNCGFYEIWDLQR